MLASTSTNTDGTIGTQKMKGSKDSITMEESSFNYSLVFSYSNNKSRISQPYDHDELEGQHNFQRCKRKGKKLRRLYFISVLEVLYHKAKEGKDNQKGGTDHSVALEFTRCKLNVSQIQKGSKEREKDKGKQMRTPIRISFM